MKKPAHELNIIEVSSPVTTAALRLLTRGRLVLTVSSVHHYEKLRLSGAVITRATCELFQTTLSSTEKESYPPAGLAWLFMNSDGALVYSVRVDELKDIPTITLVDISGKRKTELEDLTPYYSNGWANGTLDRLGPRVLEPLYSGNLAVNVGTQSFPTLVRGRLTPKPVAEARDSPAPILLKKENILPSSVVGMAWLSIDNDCHLHYDLTITGLSGYDKHMNLNLVQMPIIAPNAPVTSRHLEEFKGNLLDNSGNEQLTYEELLLLESGVKFLEVRDKDNKHVLLKGEIKQIKVPHSCLPHLTDNDVPLDRPGDSSSITVSGGHSCFHEGIFHEEGTDWSTLNDPCTMCFCQNGRVKCDVTTCPKTQCPGGERVKAANGECCPPCLSKFLPQFI